MLTFTKGQMLATLPTVVRPAQPLAKLQETGPGKLCVATENATVIFYST